MMKTSRRTLLSTILGLFALPKAAIAGQGAVPRFIGRVVEATPSARWRVIRNGVDVPDPRVHMKLAVNDRVVAYLTPGESITILFVECFPYVITAQVPMPFIVPEKPSPAMLLAAVPRIFETIWDMVPRVHKPEPVETMSVDHRGGQAEASELLFSRWSLLGKGDQKATWLLETGPENRSATLTADVYFLTRENLITAGSLFGRGPLRTIEGASHPLSPKEGLFGRVAAFRRSGTTLPAGVSRPVSPVTLVVQKPTGESAESADWLNVRTLIFPSSSMPEAPWPREDSGQETAVEAFAYGYWLATQAQVEWRAEGLTRMRRAVSRADFPEEIRAVISPALNPSGNGDGKDEPAESR